MNKMRSFNTKSAKLNTIQVKEMYSELKAGATQSEMARKYRLSIIQVGRIARGESRAAETGALDDPVANFNVTIRQDDVEASTKRLRARMLEEEKPREPVKAPSLYNDPPPYEEHETMQTVQEKLERDIGAIKPPLKVRVTNALGDFTKDDKGD